MCRSLIRDWSLITGGGGGGARKQEGAIEILPLHKGGGGGKSFSHAKGVGGGGQTSFWVVFMR